MATAGQVIKAALQQLLVQADEAPLTASEYSDAIFTMNNYMLALDAQGITLGYTEVDQISDPVTIPAGALRGLIYNLAIELSSEYDATVRPGVTEAAREGMHAMRNLGVTIGESAYPSTLPRGTGNYYDSATASGRFYPDREQEILAETTGAIGLESGTEDAV